MCADRRKHHDDEFRREALKLIKAGTEDGSLVRRPAMPVRDRVGNGMTRARSWPDTGSRASPRRNAGAASAEPAGPRCRASAGR